jgi:hypothetical protein
MKEAQMPETIAVLSLDDGVKVGSMIFEKLSGKVFDVVSIHSRHNSDVGVLEEASLKDMCIEKNDTLVKIQLKPRRCLCFDIKDSPVVTFVSDRRIDIVRKLSERDTLTKIILINEKKLVEEVSNGESST